MKYIPHWCMLLSFILVLVGALTENQVCMYFYGGTFHAWTIALYLKSK